MKTIKVFLVVLFVGLLGCADDALVGVEAEEPEIDTEAGAETDLWLDVAQTVSLDRETLHKAMTGGDMVLQMGKVTYYPDPDYDIMLPCFDAEGTLVPEVSLPLRFLVEGRVQHMGKVTGYFGGGSCLVNPDFTLTISREWRYNGEDGHAIWGTYTLTTRSDGSWTSHDVITGGIGKFAGATGWGRSVGTLSIPTVTSMGLVTAPKDVSSKGYLFETYPEDESRSGQITCQDRRGRNTTVTGTRQISTRGLSTYGWFDLVATKERCIYDSQGITTYYGTSTYTFDQGDVLRGIHAVVVGLGDPWPNDTIITGGEGRFEGATGWMNIRVYWSERYSEGEAILFMPR